jgi:hypothetical protein
MSDINNIGVSSMIRLTVYVTPQQQKALRMIYAETGQDQTESVRQAIDAYLLARKQNKK